MPLVDDVPSATRRGFRNASRRGRASAWIVLALLVAAEANAQESCLSGGGDIGAAESCGGAGGTVDAWQCGRAVENCDWTIRDTYEAGHHCEPDRCSFPNCQFPTVPSAPDFEIIDHLDGTYTARMGFEVLAPYNEEASNEDDEDGELTIEQDDNPNGTLDMFWWKAPSANECTTPLELCERSNSDQVFCFVQEADLTCAGAPYDFGVYSFRAQVCTGPVCNFPFTPSCARWVDRNNLPFKVTKEMLDCPVPRKEECRECMANVGGGGGKAPVGGAPACAVPADSGPGAMLRYAGGGVGRMGLPGTADWQPALGRNWSHDYAERIVLDPDDGHVWLLTRWATFREFSGLAGGVYTNVSPSDEYRTLERTAGGWTLTDLDGTAIDFGADGLWLSTTDRNGNAKTATYGAPGELASVDFPDGRRESFTYHAGGKLATITEIGTDGLATRTWSYTWSGDDLVRIDRPDGTASVMTYGDPENPGHLTLLELEGTDGTSRRVEQGWAYDTRGNAIRTWRGAATFAAAVDRWELAFDDPLEPTETTVTDPLGQQIVYTIGRDAASDKPRVESISGGCPGCGLESDTTFVYGGEHPLLPVQQTDAEGTVTTFTYTAAGQVETRTEAFGLPGIERTTAYTYDATFESLVAAIEQPSAAGGSNVRRTSFTRNAAGDPTGRTIEGIEAGSPFTLTTATTFNTAGLPLTVDPPGYGAADVTSFTYDPSLGGLVLTSRTAPLAGTTTFDHDAFNRRTSTIDPNGLETTSTYDDLGRVLQVVQKGAQPADDLVTTHAYTVFGDLARTTLPEGNIIDYGYDAAGRLVRIERRSADGTHRERTIYVLDGAGNRTSEQHERWDGTDWVAESWTDFEYWSRCHLGRVLHSDGTVTRYDYDCNGNLDRVWDANHPFADEVSTPPTERYVFDALDRMVEVRQPWAGAGGGEAVTGYAYDVQDHLVAVTDAEGNRTTYAYSDRDLLTQEASPVSGTTTHAYNEHGELVSTSDARAITMTRTVDEADRVTFVDYPGTDLDVTYSYGTDPIGFELGRLVGITRDGSTVTYAYDRFGRATQDGDLTYGYDRNGNRTGVGYPGGVAASYTFDFADRESALAVTSQAGTLSVVTSSSYLPSGPLASLALGNGTAEGRSFTTRYFPASVALDAVRDRSYTYTTDAVGNVTSIAEAVECPAGVVLEDRTVTGTEVHQSCADVTAGPAVTVAAGGSLTLRGATSVVLRDGFSVASGATFSAGTDPDLDGGTWTFAYQDTAYFLTSATGPWGSLAWSYDEIGNRLSETRDGWTDTYVYTNNGTGGRTPLLSEIQLAVGGTRTFTHGPAGHLAQVGSSGNVVDFTYDAAGRLEQADRLGTVTPFAYDGRSYLAAAGSEAAATGASHPVYSSAGLLHTLTQRITASDPGETHHVFHFAGRPVAQVSVDGATETWRYVTTDHLGTPLIATDSAGAELWHGPFDPFGRDRFAGTNLAAAAEDVFLRFPGQWDDRVWLEATRGAEVYYNVHRWYQPGTGRYTRPDPLGLVNPNIFSPSSALGSLIEMPYGYSEMNPLLRIDPLGLRSRVCCREIPWLPGNYRHCFIQVEREGKTARCGLFGGRFTPGEEPGIGQVRPNHSFDDPGVSNCGDWNESCDADQCVVDTARSYANPSKYRVVAGPNSNTFAGTIARACKLARPAGAGTTPGWNDAPATQAPEREPIPVECRLP